MVKPALMACAMVLAACDRPASRSAVPGPDISPLPNCRAIDGDTLHCPPDRFRLAGVAAPERAQPGGPEATAFVRKLVEGRGVACASHDVDRYGRLVGYCSVEGRDIGEALIASGLANPCRRYDKAGRYAALRVNPALPLPTYCTRR